MGSRRSRFWRYGNGGASAVFQTAFARVAVAAGSHTVKLMYKTSSSVQIEPVTTPLTTWARVLATFREGDSA